MKCPVCKGATYVTETRAVGDGTGAMKRRRSCSECLNKFVTLEAPEIQWKAFKADYAHEVKAAHEEITAAAKAVEAAAQPSGRRE